jgi:hypothetical protein
MDCWSQEDDELTMQYPGVLRRTKDRDTISQVTTTVVYGLKILSSRFHFVIF